MVHIDGDLTDIGNPIVVRIDPGDPTPADSIIVDLSEVIPMVLEFDLSDLSLFDSILLAVDGFDLLLGGIGSDRLAGQGGIGRGLGLRCGSLLAKKGRPDDGVAGLYAGLEQPPVRQP